MSYQDFSVLKGKTIISMIKNADDDEIVFETSEGDKYLMYHDQNCCESVYVESICGDIEDILNSPVLVAEEVVSADVDPEGVGESNVVYRDDSFTWTFYKIDTAKGGVTIRWYGTSNGYYSEDVSFKDINY